MFSIANLKSKKRVGKMKDFAEKGVFRTAIGRPGCSLASWLAQSSVHAERAK